MDIKRKIERFLDGRKRRLALLISVDIGCFVAVNLFYYLVAQHAANSMPMENKPVFVLHSALHLIMILLFRFITGIYYNIWRYSNTRVYAKLVVADALGSVATLVILRLALIFVPGV